MTFPKFHRRLPPNTLGKSMGCALGPLEDRWAAPTDPWKGVRVCVQTRNTQHPAHNTQYTPCNTQHTTQSTQYTASPLAQVSFDNALRRASSVHIPWSFEETIILFFIRVAKTNLFGCRCQVRGGGGNLWVCFDKASRGRARQGALYLFASQRWHSSCSRL